MKTTKSPPRVLQYAYLIGLQTLRLLSNRNSRKTFNQPQLARRLLDRTLHIAQWQRPLGHGSLGRADGTGLESRHASNYYVPAFPCIKVGKKSRISDIPRRAFCATAAAT